MTDLRAARRPPYWLTAPLVLVVTSTASWLEVGLVARVLDDCDIGINAAANSWGLLYVLLPVLVIVNALVFWATFRLSHARTALPVALVAALVALSLVLWGLVAMSVPEYYPTSCRVDPIRWWPGWLPV